MGFFFNSTLLFLIRVSGLRQGYREIAFIKQILVFTLNVLESRVIKIPLKSLALCLHEEWFCDIDRII
jgi:hypothetical protein